MQVGIVEGVEGTVDVVVEVVRARVLFSDEDGDGSIEEEEDSIADLEGSVLFLEEVDPVLEDSLLFLEVDPVFEDELEAEAEDELEDVRFIDPLDRVLDTLVLLPPPPLLLLSCRCFPCASFMRRMTSFSL